MAVSCRFYEENFPAREDLVMAKVISRTDIGVYVQLLEYSNQEALINLANCLRRAGRHLVATIKIGDILCVRVIRVDEERGWIDVAHKGISEEDKEGCKYAFSQAKCVNQILTCAGWRLGFSDAEQLEDLCSRTAWFFNRKKGQQKASYLAFQQAARGLPTLQECDLDENTKTVLLEEIKQKLAPKIITIRADVEVTCFEPEGIDAVKAALNAGKKVSSEDAPLKVTLLSSPVYQVTTQTMDSQAGQNTVEAAIAAITDVIQEYGGSCKFVRQTVSTPDDVVDTLGFEDMDISR